VNLELRRGGKGGFNDPMGGLFRKKGQHRKKIIRWGRKKGGGMRSGGGRQGSNLESMSKRANKRTDSRLKKQSGGGGEGG